MRLSAKKTPHVLLCAILEIALLVFCQNTFAAQSSHKSGGSKVFANAGQTVSTEYFSITLPKGWIMPEAINKRPDAISAVFANTRTGIAVTVNVLKYKVAAKDLALQTIRRMNESGLKTGNLQEAEGLYRLRVSGKANGEAWFGSNNGVCSATVILGRKMDQSVANEFFKVLRPLVKGLFPPAK